MDHAAGGTIMFCLHDIQRVLRRVPAVDDHRESRLLCHFKLCRKPVFLDLPLRLVPVIVKTDLTDRHNLRVFCQGFQPLHIRVRKLRRLVRMHTHRRIHEGMRLS